MIKDVIVSLSLGDAADPAAIFAVDVAARCDAHLAGLAFSYEAMIPPADLGGVSVALIESQRRDNEAASEAAALRFEEIAKRAGISYESHRLSTSAAGGADTFGRMARRFDLSVVGQSNSRAPAAGDLIAEAALFQSGRPVVMVPYIHRGGLSLERVMVCWDGGRTAARAIGDAMPLLLRATSVEVVMVTGEDGKADEIPGADMGRHLARHGLDVNVKRIVADGDVAATLLSLAADMQADFLVMGGYGHSRLREFILGGVTRTVLNSMTVPCFMSH